LTPIVLAYEDLYPDIYTEIFDKIKETDDSDKLENFEKVLKADPFLEANFRRVDLDSYL
jgi:hypothetical protein